MSRIFEKVLCFLIALCLASSCAPLALAQTQTTGSVRGVVLDAATGQPIPNATIKITNEGTGIQSKERCDVGGNYTASLLPPGDYTITASAPGYDDDSLKGFAIYVTKQGFVKAPPFALRQTGTPTTTAATPTSEGGEILVNTVNATRGGNFDVRQLLALPLPGVRTFDDLAFLLPGVAPPPLAIGTTVGPGIGPGVGTSGQFSVNGLRSRANNFTVDGSDNNDEDVGVRRQGFTSLVSQSIESVQEYHVSTLLPEPQYGRNLGGQVDAVSRSGGTDFHGTLYGFFTGSALKARDHFDLVGGPATFPITANGQAVFLDGVPLAPRNPVGGENPYDRWQYGFVLGGPIVKEKSQFFLSAEHQEIAAKKESHFAVPTVEQRGVFQTGGTGLKIGPGLFPTSGYGDRFFSLFPFPNNPLGPYGANTYTEILPASAHGTIFSMKLDHDLGANNKLSERYNLTDDATILPVTGQALFSSLKSLVRSQNFSLIFNSAGSSAITNQARFSYGRTSLRFGEVRDPFLLPSALLPNEPFLLNGKLIENQTLPGGRPTYLSSGSSSNPRSTEGADTRPGDIQVTGPIGQMIVSGYSPVGVDVFNFPQKRANNTLQFADTMIYNRGGQRFSFGVDIRRNQLNSDLERNFRPLVVFSGAQDLSKTIDPSLPANISELLKSPTAGFLVGSDFVAAGAPTGFFQTQALARDASIGLRDWQSSFFFADQMRILSNFSLTLGVRYELNTVPSEVNKRIEKTFDSPEVKEFIRLERGFNKDPNAAPFGIPLQGLGKDISGLEQFLVGRKEIFQRDNNNFAPHIAFAWDPFGTGKTSIRAGYGIYYDQIPGAVISQSRSVFPSFFTLNLAGLKTSPGPFGLLVPFNAALIAAPTLNTFNKNSPILEGLAPFSSNPVVNVLLNASLLTNFGGGPGFVLPAFDLVTPYAQHWGLTMERQIRKDFLVSVAYVGTKGTHLLRFATPNLGPNSIPVVDGFGTLPDCPQDLTQCVPLFFGTVIPPGTGNLGRPFPLLGSFTSIESDASSIYHSLQFQANKRFSHGLQFTTAYTWSHAIDEVSELFDTAGVSALPQNSFDRRAERASASFDIRHRFVYSAIWDLPFFKQRNILGGWQVASIGTFQTGQPYTVLFCCDVNLDGNLTDRPGIVPGIGSLGLGPKALATGRNSFRAPGIANVDLAVDKIFKFGERHRLQFRSEFFNLFNRTDFGIPVHQFFFGGVSPPDVLAGKHFVDTVLPARTVQFAVKYSF